MHKLFEMSQADYTKLLEACKPVPMIALQCGMPSSPTIDGMSTWRQMLMLRFEDRMGRIEASAVISD